MISGLLARFPWGRKQEGYQPLATIILSMAESWINAVVIISAPIDSDSESEQQLASNFAQQFADNPNLLVSVSIVDQHLRVKIQEPADVDLAASSLERDQAAHACAEQFTYDSVYYWEQVDQQGQLISQGERRSFSTGK